MARTRLSRPGRERGESQALGGSLLMRWCKNKENERELGGWSALTAMEPEALLSRSYATSSFLIRGDTWGERFVR
jgi:hypothetical protein